MVCAGPRLAGMQVPSSHLLEARVGTKGTKAGPGLHTIQLPPSSPTDPALKEGRP